MCEPVSAGAGLAAAGSAAAAGAGTAAAAGTAAGAAGAGMSAMTVAQLAGAAMTGLSIMAQQRAQHQVTNKRNQVAESESARQKQFQQKADVVNNETQQQFERPAQDQSRLGEQFSREQFINQNMPDLSVSGERGGAPTVVNSDLGKRMADALSYGRKSASAQAALGAYGSNQFGNQVALNRSGQKLGQVDGSSGRSSDIAGLEMGNANQAGQSSRNLADLFRLGGQTSLLYGMTRPAMPSGSNIDGIVPGQYSLTNRQYG